MTALPEGAAVLASSDIKRVQIMAIGDNLMGTQFVDGKAMRVAA